MLLSRIAPSCALLFLSSISMIGAGCALTSASSEDPTPSASLLSSESETLTLSTDVEPDLSGRCEVHALLTLSRGGDTDVREPLPAGAVLRAHLYEEATGACAARVDKAPRDYVLFLEREDCGSLVYAAATTVDGKERDIVLTDHRRRVCGGTVPALLVVEEREDSGDLRTFYLSRSP
jgi:hypothetical protein